MTDTAGQLPQHVGYIVDGNRRWAKKHGLPTYEGHLAGKNVLHDVLLETLNRGVKYASAYVFSTENWKRSEQEVGRLMKLLLSVVQDDLPKLLENNVRLRVVGTREGLTGQLVKAIDESEQKTAHCDGGDLLICLNYGGQLEVADAFKKIVQSGVSVDDITPELISENLYAPDVPPCDLIVRTSGEQRLSNFMLWRSAYSELMFVDKHWPDMTSDDVSTILNGYANRKRRFGG